MKKRLYLYNLILSILTVLIVSTGVVFAFFTTLETELMPNFTVSQSGNISIDSEFDLKLLANAGYYNDENNVTLTENRTIGLEDGEQTIQIRKSILLTSQIVLTEDLIVTSDINIDLGGASNGIDLNGHNITFRNYYQGCFLVTNGTIKNTDTENASTITTDTINATVIFDCNIDSTAGTVNNVLQSFNKDQIINAIYTYTDNCFNCFYNEEITGGNYRYYLYRDIELITTFYNFEINLSWQSSNTNVISNSGEIGAISVDTDAELTLTLSNGELNSESGGTITEPLTKTYYIKALAGDRKYIGVSEITEFLEYYTFGSSKYYIYRDTELPAGNKYYNLSYSYSVVNAEDLVNNTLQIGTVKRTIYLTATITDIDNLTLQTAEFTIYAIVDTNYEIANGFKDEISPLIINGINTELSLTSEEDLSSQAVSVTYSIVDSQDNLVDNYYIENNTIKVDHLPYYTDLIYLKANYTFIAGSPLQLVRLSRIYFLDASLGGGSTGTDPYAPYYAYLADILLEQTQIDGRTFTSFNMPNDYINLDIEYDIACDNLERVENGDYISLVYTEDIASVDTDYVIRIKSLGSNTFFEINKPQLKAEELDIAVSYIFISLDELEQEIETLYSHTSSFTLHGIIHNTDSGMPDTALYNAVLAEYDNYNDAGELSPDNYLTIYEAYMPKIEFEIQDTTINNFKGINYLTLTDGFIFDNTTNGSSTANEHFTYLNGMTNIKNLSIINNSMTNAYLPRFASLRNLEYLNLSGNSLTSISSLEEIFSNVTELHLSNNELTDVQGIENFLSVNTLYIDGNDITYFRNLIDISSLINGNIYLYDNLNTADYGSVGKYNTTTYIILYKKNISVYNTINGSTPVLFDPSSDNDLITAAQVLESIILPNQTETTIILPNKIYYSTTEYYTIIWDYTAFSVTGTTDNTPVTGEITVNHNTLTGDVEIYASVVINTTTVYRPFFIEVK